MSLWCNVVSCVKELLERMNDNTHYVSSHRESLTLLPPPPIPHRETRPRSAGYTVTTNCDTLARTPTRGGNEYSSLPVMHSSRQVYMLYIVQWFMCKTFVSNIFSLYCAHVCALELCMCVCSVTVALILTASACHVWNTYIVGCITHYTILISINSFHKSYQ